MPASTLAIDTPERSGQTIVQPVAAATLIPCGVIGAINAAGNAVNASDAAALRVIGRAEETADNTLGAAGDLSILLKRGVFKWLNSAGSAIAAADIGKVAYVEDNQTVAINSTNKLKAGRIVALESDGVWIDTRDGIEPVGVLVLASTDGTAAAASASLPNLAAETEKLSDDFRALIALLRTQGLLK